MNSIVQLESGVWLREGEGDPCRTLLVENATVYPSRKAAAAALLEARRYRPFCEAELQLAKAADNSDG